MSKGIAIGSVLVLVGTLSFLLYFTNQKLPEASDVRNSTKNLSNQPYHVLTIEKIDGEWITFLKNDNAMFVGFLQQNWLGNWKVVNGAGDFGFIGDVAFNQNREENNGLIWGASGLSKGNKRLFSYYYGMILNPEVDEVLLSTGNGDAEEVSLIESKGDGKRFFFLKRKNEPLLPFELKALSDGEVIATKS
ncbi:hypothetical protein VBD025_15325 [Virgibacillus flavescens]|uniref:hypothetical protein n=1 Tax=Virgibacillus flavescens TaxID=1611422 RepID=UPI003D32862C